MKAERRESDRMSSFLISSQAPEEICTGSVELRDLPS
jgi:hypothetical protein